MKEYLDSEGLRYAFSKVKGNIRSSKENLLTTVGGYLNYKMMPFFIEDISGEENILTIRRATNSAPIITVEKSTDGLNWETFGTTNLDGITTTIPPFGRIYLRSDATNWGTGTSISTSNNISAANNFSAGGNILSLLGGEGMTESCALLGLFANSLIVDASKLILPDNTTVRCYNFMFFGCAALTSTPHLPATILSERCYGNMFSRCTSLTQAPELSAEAMAPSCYAGMFFGCTSLTQAPVLPSFSLEVGCYNGMFNGCTSLTQAPELSAVAVAPSCYAGMFFGCTSLTQAPVLPASSLQEGCYANMFNGCVNLVYIKALFTETSSSLDLDNWVHGVATSGVFIKNSSAVWDDVGDSGVPENWYVAQSPEDSDGRILLSGDKDVSDWDLTIAYAGSRTTAKVVISIPAPGQVVMINGEIITPEGGNFNINIEQNKDSMVSFIFEGHIIPDHFYANNTTIEKIYIGRGAEAIGEQSFANCSKLEVDFSFADLLAEIGDAAFYGAGCTTVKLPKSVSTIGEGAFAWCPNLVSFDFGGCPAPVPDRMFYNSTALQNLVLGTCPYIGGWVLAYTPLLSLEIPSTLKTIGSMAFYKSSLRDVVFKEGLTEIADKAFFDCTLDKLALPSSLARIGKLAFAANVAGRGVAQLSFGDSTQLSFVGQGAFTGSRMKTVHMPPYNGTLDATFKGCKNLSTFTFNSACTPTLVGTFEECEALKSVGLFDGTVYGESVFSGCKSLLYSPSLATMTAIPAHFFENCEKLANVVIPNTVTTIGDYAFYGCKSLVRVSTCVNVTTIGDYAFYGCTVLRTLYRPWSVSSIGQYAFAYCEEIDTQMQMLAQNHTVKVGEYAFLNSKIAGALDIKDLCQDDNLIVKKGAFYGMKGLVGHYANLPRLIYGGEDDFAGSDVTFDDVYSPTDWVTFNSIDTLTLYEMPSSVETFDVIVRFRVRETKTTGQGGHFLSVGGYSVVDVSAPEAYEFGGMNFKANTEYMVRMHKGSDGVYATHSLSSNRFTPLTIADRNVILYKRKGVTDKRIDILDVSVVVDGILVRAYIPKIAMNDKLDYLVDRMTGQVVKPNNNRQSLYFRNIGNANAYVHFRTSVACTVSYSYDNLIWNTLTVTTAYEQQDISIPPNRTLFLRSNLQTSQSFEIVETNDSAQWMIGGDIRSLYDTDEIEATLYTKLFAGTNYSIISVASTFILPEPLTNIFTSLMKLGTIYLSSALTTIPARVFKNGRMSQVFIPDTVTSIGTDAFRYSFLTSIEIPDSVGTVDARAFANCASIKDIRFSSSMTVIPTGMFRQCGALLKVTIPSTIITINAEAFYGCSLLNTVEIEEGTTTLGSDVFAECSSLANVKLPTTLTSVGTYLFFNCTSLYSISLPVRLSALSDYMFAGCTSLKSMTLNNPTPMTIGTNALQDVTLEHIYVPSAAVDAYKAAEGWNDYADIITAIQ